jgi:hypothetical protein
MGGGVVAAGDTNLDVILATVSYAGWHHLVAPEDWPEALPAVILDAVRRAPGSNDDPSLRALTDTPS